MNTTFWLERWAANQIGFHQHRINEYLQQFWPQLLAPKDSAVFVPLCGKTLDMHWLREQGHSVIGVEIAPEAVRDFFGEWNVEPQVTQIDRFERWSAQHITILCGDFFALGPDDVASVRAVFDRGALIALPQPLRKRYVEHLHEILPVHCPTLLVTTDYDQSQMSGPPFAVGDLEIDALFDGHFIDTLGEFDVTDSSDNARFRQRGLTRLIERVYRIR